MTLEEKKLLDDYRKLSSKSKQFVRWNMEFYIEKEKPFIVAKNQQVIEVQFSNNHKWFTNFDSKGGEK